jgi:hypothetical protein
MPSPRPWLVPVVLAAALAACACAGRGADPPLSSAVPYFAGRTATFPGGAARELARPPWSRLRGADGPAAVARRETVVYETFVEKVRFDPQRTAREQGIRDGTVLGRLSVRAADQRGDRLLVDGAFAPAVSAAGRVAVGLLDDPDQRFGAHYDAAIAVLEPGSTRPVRWTDADRLRTPVAWVGDALLYAVPVEVGPPELWVTTGPGAGQRVVPAGSFVAAAPGRVLVAVPDGDKRALEIRSIPDGRLLARQETELHWVGLGSWTTQGIAVVGAPEPGVLTALDLGPDLRPRGKVDLRVPAELAAPPNEVAVAGDHKSFGVATFVAGAPELSWVLLSCTLATGTCQRHDLDPGTEHAGFVNNPSR